MKIRITKDIDIPDLEKRIREARKSSPKSVTQLAAEAGMSVANWYRIEGGKAEFLPKETFKAIEAALEIDLGAKLDD